jgi:hypothetical protein
VALHHRQKKKKSCWNYDDRPSTQVVQNSLYDVIIKHTFKLKGKTMRRILPALLSILIVYASNLMAKEAQPIVIPEPPELPSQIVSGENMKPDITITREKKETITEYSVNGSVYMVKISPEGAPAYYMVDSDGDGNLETRRSALEEGMEIPMWLLLSW